MINGRRPWVGASQSIGLGHPSDRRARQHWEEEDREARIHLNRAGQRDADGHFFESSEMSTASERQG
jgi:hypothetical protein